MLIPATRWSCRQQSYQVNAAPPSSWDKECLGKHHIGDVYECTVSLYKVSGVSQSTWWHVATTWRLSEYVSGGGGVGDNGGDRLSQWVTHMASCQGKLKV